MGNLLGRYDPACLLRVKSGKPHHEQMLSALPSIAEIRLGSRVKGTLSVALEKAPGALGQISMLSFVVTKPAHAEAAFRVERQENKVPGFSPY